MHLTVAILFLSYKQFQQNVVLSQLIDCLPVLYHASTMCFLSGHDISNFELDFLLTRVAAKRRPSQIGKRFHLSVSVYQIYFVVKIYFPM